jgi:hypothetical protein
MIVNALYLVADLLVYQVQSLKLVAFDDDQLDAAEQGPVLVRIVRKSGSLRRSVF